jgi:hypothetical protein
MKFVLFFILMLNLNFIFTAKLHDELAMMTNSESNNPNYIDGYSEPNEDIEKPLLLGKRRNSKDFEVKQNDEFIYRKYCIKNKKFCYFFG